MNADVRRKALNEYIERTRNYIAGERDRVCAILRERPELKVYEPKANFVLVRILKEDLDADRLFDHCIRKGLMIRNCSTFPFLSSKYIRFCFMSPEDNNRLLALLESRLESAE